MSETLLTIQNLSVAFKNTYGQATKAVDNVNLQILAGETLAIVGESGCGKSTLAMSILGLHAKANTKTQGEILFENRNLVTTSETEMQTIRGKRIAMIFQDPMNSLNPYMTIGSQIAEQIIRHQNLSKQEITKKVVALLDAVGIANPERRAKQYPHEFSGGMRQRAMIACALSCEPTLLIADEPTTALDVTIQAQIMALITDLIHQHKMSLLLITHDLSVVAETCENVAVMYAGQIIEKGKTKEIFQTPQHPYTHALLQSLPKLTDQREFKLLTIPGQPPIIREDQQTCRFYERCAFRNENCKTKPITVVHKSPTHTHLCTFIEKPLESFTKETYERHSPLPQKILTVDHLKIWFHSSKGLLQQKTNITKAVDDVSLYLNKGEVLGLVGESGCGKSTLIRGILQLIRPDSGSVFFNHLDLTQASNKQIVETRQKMQLIFQDPFGSLNSHLKVFDIIAEPLVNFYHLTNQELKTKVFELMQEVGLNPEMANRYPHQFSGGQRQRIGIARALSVQPEILFCDEPISALDVSIQAQIINLLQELQLKRNLSIIFISHDLSVVRRISDRIAVMYKGKIVEIADAETIYTKAQHPYTQSLLLSIPKIDFTAQKPYQTTTKVNSSNLANTAEGCLYYPTCPIATEKCTTQVPQLQGTSQHQIACFHKTIGDKNHMLSYSSITFCGIGGSGMSAIAQVLAAQNIQVSGTDRNFDRGNCLEAKGKLEKQNIKIFPQDGSFVIDKPDALVISSAVEKTIPDVKAAIEQNIPIIKRAELLAQMFNQKKGLAIAGTSGKSTVTGMAGYLLYHLQQDPVILNGGVMENFKTETDIGNAYAGGGDWMIIEADESDGTIELYNPYGAILTNISLDHKSLEELRVLFLNFCNRVTHSLILNLDCPEIQQLLPQIQNKNIKTFSLTNEKADYCAQAIKTSPTHTEFTLKGETFHLNLPGRYNIANALAAIALCHSLGLELSQLSQALQSFKGIGRRLQKIGSYQNFTVYDDFAHNPEKVEATLKTLQEHLLTENRLVIMYQPHGFAPTRLLKEGFIKVFSNELRTNDLLLLPEIFYAGGTTVRDISSNDLVQGVVNHHKQALFFQSRNDIKTFIIENFKPTDTIVIMGARDDTLTNFAREIFSTIQDKLKLSDN